MAYARDTHESRYLNRLARKEIQGMPISPKKEQHLLTIIWRSLKSTNDLKHGKIVVAKVINELLVLLLQFKDFLENDPL